MTRLTAARIAVAPLGAVLLYISGFIAMRAYHQMTRGITYVIVEH